MILEKGHWRLAKAPLAEAADFGVRIVALPWGPPDHTFRRYGWRVVVASRTERRRLALWVSGDVGVAPCVEWLRETVGISAAQWTARAEYRPGDVLIYFYFSRHIDAMAFLLRWYKPEACAESE